LSFIPLHQTSSDVKDIAQLLFLLGVNEDCEVTEELAGMWMCDLYMEKL
jgi:hypothetical protein